MSVADKTYLCEVAVFFNNEVIRNKFMKKWKLNLFQYKEFGEIANKLTKNEAYKNVLVGGVSDYDDDIILLSIFSNNNDYQTIINVLEQIKGVDEVVFKMGFGDKTFITNDINKRFFREEFCIEYRTGTDYADSQMELIESVNKHLSVDVKTCDEALSVLNERQIYYKQVKYLENL